MNWFSKNISLEFKKIRVTIYNGKFNNNFGTIDSNSNIVNVLINNINSISQKKRTYVNNVFMYRKYEYHSDDKKIYSPTTIQINGTKTYILILEGIEEKNIGSFPMLSKYHNEITENITEYQIGTDKILLINDSKNIKYVRLEFNNTNLDKINNLISAIMKGVF